MAFELKEGEKIVWKGETDGKAWAVWPEVDDGNPATDDGMSDRTAEYRASLGIRSVAPGTNRFCVVRDSEAKIDAWLKARGIPLSFAGILAQGNP